MKIRILLLTLVFLATSCADFLAWPEPVQDVLDRIPDVPDFPDLPDLADLSVDSLQVLGATPASDFSDSNTIEFGLLARNGMNPFVTSMVGEELIFEVRNKDGDYERCEVIDTEKRPGSADNAFSVLVDGSGSMEVTYPRERYGDLCLSCPHDPNRERVGATYRFIWKVQDIRPDSLLTLAEFGPPPTHGFRATRLLVDWDESLEAAEAAVEKLMGYEMYGTPLWDSAHEMLQEFSQIDAGHGRHMVILSDGEDNESTRHSLRSVIEEARRQGVAVYAVGLGPASATVIEDANRPIVETDTVLDLQQLAASTGGFYSSVDEPRRLYDLFDAVAGAVAGGYETTRARCPTGPVPRGERVQGRVSHTTASIPFAFLAP